MPWQSNQEESSSSLDDVSTAASGAKQPVTKQAKSVVDATKQQDLVRLYIREDLWNKDKAIVLKALLELSDMCCDTVVGSQTRNNRRLAFLAGGHLSIIKCMERFPDSESMQAAGCRALQNLAVRNGDYKLGIAVAGGIEGVIVAMMTFPDSARVQESGCAALQNLSAEKYVRKPIVEAGGIGVIAKAMKTHKDDATLQSHACVALYNLSHEEKTKEMLEKNGALSALAVAVEHNPDHDKTRKWGRKAMKRFM